MECKDFEPSIIQEKRILRLCRRLDKFTLDEISTIAEDIDESVLELLLLTLVQEGKLMLQNDFYLYIRKKVKVKTPSCFRNFSNSIIDLVIRCFCCEITADKAHLITNVGESSVADLYDYFRKILYTRQYKFLSELYSKSPQKGRVRKFFDDMPAYFYIYNNNIYITDKLFQTNDYEKNFSASEIKEFKKIYCYLARIESHNKNKINLYYKLSESLWRRNKKFEELYQDLKSNLFNIS